MSEHRPDDVVELEAVLRRMDLLDADRHAEVLGGGVSSIVARFAHGDDQLIAKSPRTRFAVGDEWVVARERGNVEAAILAYVDGALGGLATPRLVAHDPESIVLVEAAMAIGDGSQLAPTYKSELLAGFNHPGVAHEVGHGLHLLHQMAVPAFLKTESTEALFVEQRLDPYFETTAVRHPDLADALRVVIDALRRPVRRTVVHGDANPKNVLCIDGGRAGLVDWEVAHCGDPSFDVGMMCAHLSLKSLREEHPVRSNAILGDLVAFVEGYGPLPDQRLSAVCTGAIMLARLYGKSRIDYLDDRGIARADRIARDALDGVLTGVDSIVAAIGESIASYSA